MASTAAKDTAEAEQKQRGDAGKPKAAADGQSTKGIVSYWVGIEPRKLVKEDGTERRWFCFRVSTATAQHLPLAMLAFTA
jgi:ubiquinol oxidase